MQRGIFNARAKMTIKNQTTAFFLTMLLSAVVSAQQKPTTGYAPVNGLEMYYENHGSGDPVVLLHGSFMTITNNWTGWIGGQMIKGPRKAWRYREGLDVWYNAPREPAE